MQDGREDILMWWFIAMVWFLGWVTAFYLLELEKIRFWKDRGYKVSLLDELSAFPTTSILYALASWFMVIGIAKFWIEDNQRRARLAKAQSDLENLRQHIERMDWK